MGDDLDPFGRKKHDNPLASLGWHDDESASTTEAEPPPAPVAVGAEQPQQARRDEPVSTAGSWSRPPPGDRTVPPQSPRPRRGTRGGRAVRAVITVIVVIVALNVLIAALIGEGGERAERFVREFQPPGVQTPAVPGSEEDSSSDRQQPAPPARGLSANSLLRPAAFGRALARLRTGGYGRLTNLRVAPDRIDATMVTKGGRLRLLQIVPGGAVRVLQTTTGRFAGARTMTLKGIDPRAPNPLTRSAAGRLEQPASRVDYLVLMDFAGARGWNAYFKGGRIFMADVHGRITRRIS